MVSTAKGPSWPTSTARSLAFVPLAHWGSSTVTSSSPSSPLRTVYDGGRLAAMRGGHAAGHKGGEFVAAAVDAAASGSPPSRLRAAEGGEGSALAPGTGADSVVVVVPTSPPAASGSPLEAVSGWAALGLPVRGSGPLGEVPAPLGVVEDDRA
eukprot:2727513-Pyramimonas_sp.AAC.1